MQIERKTVYEVNGKQYGTESEAKEALAELQNTIEYLNPFIDKVYTILTSIHHLASVIINSGYEVQKNGTYPLMEIKVTEKELLQEYYKVKPLADLFENILDKVQLPYNSHDGDERTFGEFTIFIADFTCPTKDQLIEMVREIKGIK